MIYLFINSMNSSKDVVRIEMAFIKTNGCYDSLCSGFLEVVMHFCFFSLLIYGCCFVLAPLLIVLLVVCSANHFFF